MNMWQTLPAVVIALTMLGCATKQSAQAPAPAPAPASRSVSPGPDATTAAKPDPTPDSVWTGPVAEQAQALASRFPEATVRIAVVDVGSGAVVASAGPVDQSHPTGSTIKTFTIAAALEAGIAADAPLDTGDGSATIGDRTIRDHAAHGTISVTEALARSSNVGIVRIAEQVGVAALYRRVGAIIPLPPANGLSEAEQAILLFGGGTSMSTQDLVGSYAMLAAHGRDPRSDEQRVQVQTSRAMLTMLQHAVTAPSGTGRHAAVPGRSVGGKTGTAPDGHEQHTALFVGLAESAGAAYAVGVVVQGVPKSEFGSTVAASTFARLVQGTPS